MSKLGSYLRQKQNSVDFGISFCYNSNKIIFEGMFKMSKPSNQIKAQKLLEERNSGVLECCGEIVKENNKTIRHTITKCEEIITSPNVSEKLKVEAFNTINREQAYRTVMVLSGMVLTAIVAAYGIKTASD